MQTKNILITTLQRIWKVLNDHRSWISAFILFIAFIFIGLALRRGWTQIGPYLRQINLLQLVIAEGFIAMALILGAANWHFIQKAYELNLSGLESARAHFSSNVTKYVPGYAWQYMSKAYLSGGKKENLPNVTLALLTEFIVLILSGFFLLGLFSIIFPAIPAADLFSPTFCWAISVASLLAGTAWFIFSFRFLKWKHKVIQKGISIFGALLCSLAGWISLGLATWYVVSAFIPALTLRTFPQIQFAIIGSMVLSILIIFVPGGIGIRESALAFLLQGILPLSMGVVVSIILRIGIIFGELVSFLFTFKGLRPFFVSKNPK